MSEMLAIQENQLKGIFRHDLVCASLIFPNIAHYELHSYIIEKKIELLPDMHLDVVQGFQLFVLLSRIDSF